MMSNQQKGLPKQGGPANKKHSRKMGGWDVIAIKGQKPSCILELESCCSAFVALQLFQLYCIYAIVLSHCVVACVMHFRIVRTSAFTWSYPGYVMQHQNLN